MPVCHKRKFIFFHIPRCGGTSVEVGLELTKAKNLYGVTKRDSQTLTLHHLTPGELLDKSLVSEDELARFFKFTIVREPFDRMASDFCWHKRLGRRNRVTDLSFTAYLELAESVLRNERFHDELHLDHFRPMIDFCLLDGRLVLDDVFRLESLDQEWDRLKPVVGSLRLPHLNHVANYEDLRTQANLDKVYQLYACDKLFYENLDLVRTR